jgi:hypothetical protein
MKLIICLGKKIPTDIVLSVGIFLTLKLCAACQSYLFLNFFEEFTYFPVGV